MKGKNLAILAAVVIALLAYILLFERHQPTSDEARRDADKVLQGLEEDDVTGLLVVGPKGRVRLERLGDEWRLREPIDYPADASIVSSTLGSLANLSSDRRLAAGEVDLAEYGLDDPVAEVTLTLDDGSDISFTVGDEMPLGSKRPVMVDAGGEIAIVPGWFIDDLERDVDDWRSREVTNVRADQVASIEIEAGDDTIRAVRVGRNWQLLSPVKDLADRDHLEGLVSDLDALRIGNRDLIEASRDRLRALGLEAGLAERLARGGRASGRVAFHAPISGVVTELAVREGAMVSPNMAALTITELGSLWVIAEVPESQAAWVRAGTAAELRLPSLPGETLAGRVDYVYPDLDIETRTLRARVVLDRPPAGILPNMLANVTLIGEAGAPAVTVPRSALIRSGREDRVVVALGEGRFAPRRVVAGPESGDSVVIREGLAAGEDVVVAGQFLLDSEANLRAGMGRLSSETEPPK